MPPRWAASSFSFRPPIGRTSPRKVISPVMATSLFTGMSVNADTSAVTHANSRTRAVLWRRALGHVNVHIKLLVEVLIDAESRKHGCVRPSSQPVWTLS